MKEESKDYNRVSYSIKDLPEEERPRERLFKYGPKVLKTSELIAIIIRSGSKGETAIQLAERILHKYDGNLRRIADAHPKQIAKDIKGLGESKTSGIIAAFELGRRLAAFVEEKPQIHQPADVARLMMSTMRDLKKENLYVLCLDTKNFVTKQKRIFEGSLNASIVHPREIFRFAISEAAASIILVHNHPSGEPKPSQKDIKSTHQLVEAGECIQIPVIDHIIIGDGCFMSFKEEELI